MQKRLCVRIDQQEFHVPVYLRGDSLWFHFQGQNCEYKIPRQNSAQESLQNGADGVFRAMMPGKILKLAVQEGDTVEAGQLLVVMEAMKMEYSMAASFAGSVRALTCKEGDNVALGDVLLRVEATEASP